MWAFEWFRVLFLLDFVNCIIRFESTTGVSSETLWKLWKSEWKIKTKIIAPRIKKEKIIIKGRFEAISSANYGKFPDMRVSAAIMLWRKLIMTCFHRSKCRILSSNLNNYEALRNSNGSALNVMSWCESLGSEFNQNNAKSWNLDDTFDRISWRPSTPNVTPVPSSELRV